MKNLTVLFRSASKIVPVRYVFVLKVLRIIYQRSRNERDILAYQTISTLKSC